ncbi:hypothetical protein F8388_011638 [Cannabis sativa]|uniref:Calcineurin-like phosphoesterase domain-containing protein n=1 Tax=Cannabis sativa TaxID=3483 RepID=A0A7J6DV46_CANSA|nr:hypothetical protein G4B88_024486 [Cannabis sativa]KAF4387490.1 hypothetical protein F8388_011638 [Cannabis sativa]
MASLCLNSLPLPPSSQPQPKKLVETSLFPSVSYNSTNGLVKGGGESLKPIVISGNPPTYVSAPGRRIVAVGDLHGDLEQTRCALEMAGVLSNDGQDLWVGGETVLVQLGDILDRGEDEIAILSLLRSLDIQAKSQGGAVFQVNGNHETMNVEGDFRYVDPGSFDECSDFLEYSDEYQDDWDEAFINWIGVSSRWKENQKSTQNYWGPWNIVKVVMFLNELFVGQRQKGVIARSILMRPGGKLACELARHSIVLKINDWVFCHGGLLPHHVEYGIDRINREVSLWMRGLNETDDGPRIPFLATRGYDSVVWNRLYSRDSSELEDYQIEQAIDARAMVVGHTPQMEGVNCKYNCNIWRIDVGMSSGVLNSMPEVLEIRDNKARVIKSKSSAYSELQAADYT